MHSIYPLQLVTLQHMLKPRDSMHQLLPSCIGAATGLAISSSGSYLTDYVAGRARIIVMLHPEDEEGAAQRKVAAMTGIEALGGGAKVSHSLCYPCNICKSRIGKWRS